MKKIILMLSLLTISMGCSADMRRHHYYDDDDHYYETRRYPDNHNFWNQVDQRMNRLYQRIEQGERDGRLNYKEARKLHKYYARVEDRIEQARCERRFNHGDRRHIGQLLDKIGDKIYRYSHNNHYVRQQSRYNRYTPNRGITWSNNDSGGMFYFRF